MMCDEQWSEWVEWNGGECLVHPDLKVEVRFAIGSTATECAGYFEWDYDSPRIDKEGRIVAYRYKLPIGEQLIDALQECVDIERPYDAYTTDELVHAVRGMREEIKRRCKV